MTSTEAGIAIDFNPLSAKTIVFSRDNFDSLESVTDARDPHFAKHVSQMTSTEAGIAIDVISISWLSYHSITKLIPFKKLMSVIG
jgi:hypothetical protein